MEPEKYEIPTIIDLNSIECTQLSLSEYNKDKTTTVYYENNANFIIKPEILCIVKNTRSYIDVELLGKDDVDKITEIDDTIINAISLKSKQWFDNDLDNDDVDDMFLSSIKTKRNKTKMRIHCNEETDVYDANKTLISFDDLQVGDCIKALLKCDFVEFHATTCELKWFLYQCMKTENKNEESKFERKPFILDV